MRKLATAYRLLHAGAVAATGRGFPRLELPDFSRLREQCELHTDLSAYLQFAGERSFAPAEPMRQLRIWCTVCNGARDVSFEEPWDWREQGTCSGCGLAARQRFCVSWLAGLAGASSDQPRVYLTEQATRMHYLVRRMYRLTSGSEYAGDPRRALALQRAIDYHCGGPWRSRLQHQDITALDFPDRHFDVVGSFDVLEHVPDYQRAIGELFRVTKPGGWLILTAPFLDRSATTLVRAAVDASGVVRHLCPPEYHGEPVDDDGCLCFYHFGWDLLDCFRDAGFSNVSYVHTQSMELGFPGRLGAFVAQRPLD
jgi:SAM-dependent methyltransferase